MILLSKILLKFTPKLNKLHLTTTTLLWANFRKIYSKLHHLFFSQTPYSNGLATIALFLCNKWRFLEFSEGKIVSKYTSNSAIYQHFPRMPSNPPSGYMTTLYHYFLPFLRQNRNKTCPEPQKYFRGACSRTLLAIMGTRRNFRRGGGQAQKEVPIMK